MDFDPKNMQHEMVICTNFRIVYMQGEKHIYLRLCYWTGSLFKSLCVEVSSFNGSKVHYIRPPYEAESYYRQQATV